MSGQKCSWCGVWVVGVALCTLVCSSPPAWAQYGDVKPPTTAAGVEDNGSLPTANVLTQFAHGPIRLKAVIGDGPYGSGGAGTGDYDWWGVSMNGGWTISIDLDATDALGSSLDPVVGVYDSTGALLAMNDDFWSLDSYLEFTAPSGGIYYVVVRSFGSLWQTDPFDSSSGGGVVTEGDYIMTLALHAVQP